MNLIDCTYGNTPQDLADRMVDASWARAEPPFVAGETEPWISEIVAALLKATGIPSALETGAFTGRTSRVLWDALQDMGGGHLTICEIEEARAIAVAEALPADNTVHCTVRQDDALSVIRSLPDHSLGLAWVDDDHTMAHVSDEVAALWSKMAPRGIIALHDVYGVCDLRKVVGAYGGFCLELPRCGPAGGLGIIQPIR